MSSSTATANALLSIMPCRCSRVTMNGGARRRRPSPRASRTRDTARASHEGGTGIPSASRALGGRDAAPLEALPAEHVGVEVVEMDVEDPPADEDLDLAGELVEGLVAADLLQVLLFVLALGDLLVGLEAALGVRL